MKPILTFLSLILPLCIQAALVPIQPNPATTNVEPNVRANIAGSSGVSTNATDGGTLSGLSGNFSGISVVSFSTNSPAIPIGPAGSWDAGQVRDPVIWSARGSFHCLYIGLPASSAGAQIGYASSIDGINWTKSPFNPVITTNKLDTNTWFSGNLISPGCLYDPNTDETWPVIGGTTNSSTTAYQVGTYVFGLMHVAAGGSYTNPASYVWYNVTGGATNPIISTTQGWENTNLYAPCILYRPKTTDPANKLATIYWTSGFPRLTGGGTFTLPSTQSTAVSISKFSNNPLIGGVNMQAEEPCILPLQSGGFVDLSAGDIALIGSRFPVAWTPDINGQTGWRVDDTFSVFNGIYTNVGAPAVCQKPDGTFLLIYPGLTNSTASRVLASSTIRLNVPTTLLVADTIHASLLHIGNFTNANLAGTAQGGNGQDSLNSTSNNFISTPLIISAVNNPFIGGWGRFGDVDVIAPNGFNVDNGVSNSPSFSRVAGQISIGQGSATFSIANNTSTLSISNNVANGDINIQPNGSGVFRVPNGNPMAGNGSQITNLNGNTFTITATNRLVFASVSSLTNTLGREATAIVTAGTSVAIQDTNGVSIATIGTISTLDVLVPMHVNMRLSGTGVSAILY